MSEEENLRENDILFQIDMQLYDEFNDKIAGMNDHLGDIYSLRDVEEVEKAQKDREIELLRKAIVKQQKEIEELKKYYATRKEVEELKEINKCLHDSADNYVHTDKIIAKIEEVDKREYNMAFIISGKELKQEITEVLKSLLEKEDKND